MKFSENWLREWVNPDVSREELIARLSMSGLEVDAVEPVAGIFSGVVVGEVLSVAPHPDADKLRICQVSNGRETLQVVCGAPNAHVGLKVPFAQIDAVLPGDFKIKKAKLRGQESNGMLCSARELELSEEHEGLLELPVDAPVGEDLRTYLQLDDVSIEVDLTPNRGDCLSIAGIARDIGAIYQVPVQTVVEDQVPAVNDETRPIDIEEGTACPRYLGRVVRNVDLSRPTPLWMTERLRRSGLRSIDPAVDVTNYVLLELGQPMHAFDLAQIRGGIRVRLAHEGEELALLDGQNITLHPDTLVIADHERPLSMGGIRGGKNSGVTKETRDLFLESAYFDPIVMAGKARSYGISTDASHRYERGVDWQLQRRAMERATRLLLDIVGGEPGPVVEAVDRGKLPTPLQVNLRLARVEQVLGMPMNEAQVESLLRALGTIPEKRETGVWQVDIPTYRFDLAIEVDLIEELARLYGYNRLPVRYPAVRLAPAAKSETRLSLSALRRILVTRDYHEAITYSFIDPRLFALFHPDIKPVTLANPISADMSCMRASLWPGLVKALRYNLNRQQSRVRLFESGLRFAGQLDDGLRQEMMLAGIAYGSRFAEGWASGRERVDFYDVKADVESLLMQSGGNSRQQFIAAKHPALHPGQSARIERDGNLLGWIGALHPELAKALDIDQPVFLFELNLLALQRGVLPAFQGLSRFPEVLRDLAVLVDRSVAAADLLEAARTAAGEYLTNLRLFDVYEGKGIDSVRKSVAFGLTWQHPSRTLEDDEINTAVNNITQLLENRFNATLRK